MLSLTFFLQENDGFAALKQPLLASLFVPTVLSANCISQYRQTISVQLQNIVTG